MTKKDDLTLSLIERLSAQSMTHSHLLRALIVLVAHKDPEVRDVLRAEIEIQGRATEDERLAQLMMEEFERIIS